MDKSQFDFIIDGIVFSYSSVSTFENCPYSFKLTYIDALPREKNFFSDFGLLVHDCFEQFFGDKLSYFELSDYYKKQFDVFVTSVPPQYPAGMLERYRENGQEFFDNFFFEKDNYEMLFVEDTIDLQIGDVLFTARPDLVLIEKETGKHILLDYKTSTPYRIDKRNGKEIVDNQKIAGYLKQMYLYTHAVMQKYQIKISEIKIWYPRLNRIDTYVWDEKEETKVIKWLNETVKKIKNETDFTYDNSSKYFCQNLCGVRDFCEYKPK